MNLHCIKYFLVFKDQIIQENKITTKSKFSKITLEKKSENIIHINEQKFNRYETDFLQSICDKLNFLFNYMETPKIEKKFLNVDLKQVFMILEYETETIYQCVEKNEEGFACYYYKETTTKDEHLLKLMVEEPIIYYKDGEKMYEGDVQNGYGKYYSEDGILLYEGYFKNKKFHGKGKQYIPFGIVYEGEFENGKKKGSGIFYQEDGKIFEGKLEED
jgi:hypothetical protein